MCSIDSTICSKAGEAALFRALTRGDLMLESDDALSSSSSKSRAHTVQAGHSARRGSQDDFGLDDVLTVRARFSQSTCRATFNALLCAQNFDGPLPMDMTKRLTAMVESRNEKRDQIRGLVRSLYTSISDRLPGDDEVLVSSCLQYAPPPRHGAAEADCG